MNTTQCLGDTPVEDDARRREDLVDRRLLHAIAEHRDEKAMETFYHRYQGRLTPFLMRLTHDQSLLQETYNDVMHKVWRKAHQYRGQSMVSSWVFSIGYRACLKTLKKAQRQTHRQAAEDTVAEQAASDDRYDDQQAIRRGLDALSADHRMVLELAYFQGLPMKDIALVLGRPVNTVKTRLHHARKHLRRHLEASHGF